MRVIAGRFRSRVLAAPEGMGTRPTSDRLRETLFNVLTQGAVDRVDGGVFLDLYAGSGAVGIEALSRRAAAVTFVEQGGAALRVLERNLAGLGVGGGVGTKSRSAEKGEAAHPGPQRRGIGGTRYPDAQRLGTGGTRVRVEKMAALRFLKSAVERGEAESGAAGRFGVVFLDPPYDAADEYASVLGLLGGDGGGLLAEGAVVVAEHRRKDELAESFGALRRVRLLRQGDAALSFYEVSG